MENQTRFAKVVEHIRATTGDNQSDIARNISKYVIGIDRIHISKYKKNDPCAGPEVIAAMHKHYHINPNYLNGTSDVLLDGAGLLLEKFNSIFQKWSTVEKKYTNDKGVEVSDTYLHLVMNECDYKFLQKVDHARFLQEQGMHSFDEELSICKTECNNTNSTECEYVLIPRNRFIEMIGVDQNNRKSFDSLIDLQPHSHYCDNETPT